MASSLSLVQTLSLKMCVRSCWLVQRGMWKEVNAWARKKNQCGISEATVNTIHRLWPWKVLQLWRFCYSVNWRRIAKRKSSFVTDAHIAIHSSLTPKQKLNKAEDENVIKHEGTNIVEIRLEWYDSILLYLGTERWWQYLEVMTLY